MIIPYWGLHLGCDNSQSQKILGIKYTDVEKTIPEMADAIIEIGLIRDLRQKK